jgi:hypothetical protein
MEMLLFLVSHLRGISLVNPFIRGGISGFGILKT